MRPTVALSMQCSDDGRSFGVPQACVQLIESAGSDVVLVKPAISLCDFQKIMQSCQGFMVPGGNSIEPWRYGGVLQQRAVDDEPVPQRDEFELAAVKWVVEQGIPYLGVCRGLQVLNVAFGGTLRALSQSHPIDHWPSDDMTLAAHDISLVPEGLLARVLQCGRMQVNSLHRQCVATLGEGLVVEATAGDGVVEAACQTGRSFVVGVQWHPETMPENLQSQMLARAFVDACTKVL